MSSVIGWVVVSVDAKGHYQIVSGENLSNQETASNLAMLFNRRAYQAAYLAIPVTLGYAPHPLGFEVVRPTSEGLWAAETGIHPTAESGLEALRVLRPLFLVHPPRLAALIPIEDLFP